MADAAEHVHRPKAQQQDVRNLVTTKKAPGTTITADAGNATGGPRQSARLFSYGSCSRRLTLGLAVWSVGR